MKTKIFLLLLAFVSILPCSYTSAGNANVKPEKMRILYLGGYSDWTRDCPTFKTPEDFQKTVDLRMDAFGTLLRKYFGTVKVMKAADYKPEMSKGFDVTIFDGVPPELEKAVEVYDGNGKIVKYTNPRYLPYDFSYPSITIGEIGPTIGRRIGIKNDWFCLCMSGYAHSFKANHAIFKGPFKTGMTLEKRATPEDAKEYSYFKDVPIPESLMMWKVQTKSYETDPGFAVGMVSRPNGYLDSPDCEIISGGESHKSVDAVAIGRHGNFLTWGFAASPLYMTEEAKVVFVNAVAYMAKFKGGIIARKYNEGIPVRKDAEMYKYLASKGAYQWVADIMAKDAKMRLDSYKAALAKQTKGEELTQVDDYFLKNYNPADSSKVYSYSDHLQRYLGDLYPLLGADESKYKIYFDVNRPYLYAGSFGQTLPLVDEDAKTLGIPNNDKRILDKAISMLEEGTNIDMANRILHRYTLCNFATPSQWRGWYKKYNSKMFFTEAGGWLYLINGPSSLPGNNYANYRKQFDDFIPQSTSNNTDADAKNPVVITSALKKSGESKFLEVSFKVYAGFHVYKNVSSNDSYIPLKIEITLPDGYTKKGEMIIPPAIKFGSSGTTVFESNFVCAQSISGQASGKAIVKVTYQTCNDQMCMPPETKEFQVTL